MNEFRISKVNKDILALAEKLHKDKLLSYDDIENARNYFKINPRGTKTCKFLKDKLKNPELADIDGETFSAAIEKECKDAEKMEGVASKIGSKVLASFAAVHSNPAYISAIKMIIVQLGSIDC